MIENKNVVSIWCITYNHKQYIRQCLDGFVMQKTTFPFVAIVHDDASSDGTKEIIMEYAQKYPAIIYPIIQKENQFSKGFEEPTRLKLELCRKTKYVACCEGDDYWTDPLKLQKQFDFMESHPDYSACFHQAYIHYENSAKEDEVCGVIENRDYTGLELYSQEHRPPTASFFFKSSVYDSIVYKKYLKAKMIFGDIPLFLTCAQEGKIRGMSDIMSVYRKHASGLTNTFNSGSKRMLRFADDQLKIYKIFGQEYKKECINIHVVEYLNYFFMNRQEGRLRLKSLLKVILKFPITTFKFLYERWTIHKS